MAATCMARGAIDLSGGTEMARASPQHPECGRTRTSSGIGFSPSQDKKASPTSRADKSAPETPKSAAKYSKHWCERAPAIEFIVAARTVDEDCEDRADGARRLFPPSWLPITAVSPPPQPPRLPPSRTSPLTSVRASAPAVPAPS